MPYNPFSVPNRVHKLPHTAPTLPYNSLLTIHTNIN